MHELSRGTRAVSVALLSAAVLAAPAFAGPAKPAPAGRPASPAAHAQAHAPALRPAYTLPTPGPQPTCGPPVNFIQRLLPAFHACPQ